MNELRNKKYWFLVVLPMAFVMSCGSSEGDVAEENGAKAPLIVETDEVGYANDADVEISNTIPTEGMEDGYFEQTYPNGNKQVEGMVVNGKRSGNWVYYHPAGNKQSENNYINGELDGKTVVYYPTGQVMYIGYYTYGKSDGQWIYFDLDGTLTKEVIFKDGEIVSETEKNEKPS